jgi:hypothetical protein
MSEHAVTSEPFSSATNYHDSIDHLRRDLMKAQAYWERVVKEYDSAGRPQSAAEAAAFMAAMMAGSYAYTLAAILGHARKHGEDVARDLSPNPDVNLRNLADAHDAQDAAEGRR